MFYSFDEKREQFAAIRGELLRTRGEAEEQDAAQQSCYTAEMQGGERKGKSLFFFRCSGGFSRYLLIRARTIYSRKEERQPLCGKQNRVKLRMEQTAVSVQWQARGVPKPHHY